jgi:Undecaprenyl-phosphate galactose phosphotransferase WbaP
MVKPGTPQFQVFAPTVYANEWVYNRRTLMSFVLAVADLLAIFVAWVLAFFIRFTLFGLPIPPAYEIFAILLLLVLMLNSFSGLYNHNLSEVEQLRRACKSTTICFIIAATIFYITKNAGIASSIPILLAWVFSIVLVPFLRELVRSTFVRMHFWGEPVIIFGNGPLSNEVATYLRAHPRLGYNPVGAVDRRKTKRDSSSGTRVIYDASIFTNEDAIPNWLKDIHTAFVVTPETSQAVHEMLIDKQTIRFEQLIMVSSAERTGSLWIQPLDIGGILGLKVGQNLLNRSQLLVKRVMDLTIIILAIPFLVPLFGLVALLIKSDSLGSVFYQQDRIGIGGKIFNMWKFRSMYQDAEKKLIEYLTTNPDLKAEYEVSHKLKDDPRVTRIGKLLRKFSIDELPQLINVLSGEMSLVGPRPFMPEEISFYEKCYSLYTYVLPGVTGLWQISGRSNVTYSTRVNMDEYYLRNWSIWLDIHILSRTLMVVLRGRGSY